MTTICETERLRLRELEAHDAAFMHRLMTDAAWLRYIGDRGVRTVEQAAAYVQAAYVASYREHGFGMWLAEDRETGAPLGVCGLVQRPFLPEPDLGFGFAPEARRHGHGREASEAVIAWAREHLDVPRLLAVTSLENPASIGLLGRLGFRERTALASLLPDPGRVFERPLS